MRRIPARPRPPLDHVIHKHALPLLEAAGATRRGRRFRLTDADGNATVLDFQATAAFTQGAAAFQLRYWIVPAVLRDWVCREAAERVQDFDLFGIGPGQIEAPPDLSDPSGRCSAASSAASHTWEFDPEDGVAGATLERVLREAMIPRLTALLDPRSLLDAEADCFRRHPPGLSDRQRLMLLLYHGPSSELAQLWAELDDDQAFSSALRRWAEDRLRDRFDVEPDWRRQVPVGTAPGSPTQRLRALAGRHAAPLLLEAGFSRFGSTFLRHLGLSSDELAVDVRPAWSGTGQDAVVFTVEVSLVPARRRPDRDPDPAAILPRLLPHRSAGNGWCLRRVTPTEAYVHRPTQLGLGLDLWHCARDDADACGLALAEEVGTRLPELSRFARSPAS